MKVKEAPEKIYIPTILAANTVRYKEEGSIEYTHTDAFIEKAATWFANRYQANGSYLNADDFEDFKNYMKGE